LKNVELIEKSRKEEENFTILISTTGTKSLKKDYYIHLILLFNHIVMINLHFKNIKNITFFYVIIHHITMT